MRLHWLDGPSSQLARPAQALDGMQTSSRLHCMGIRACTWSSTPSLSRVLAAVSGAEGVQYYTTNTACTLPYHAFSCTSQVQRKNIALQIAVQPHAVAPSSQIILYKRTWLPARQAQLLHQRGCQHSCHVILNSMSSTQLARQLATSSSCAVQPCAA
jgi:hypothetical protein